jgi:3-oxoacyl-(acyl-carrier-protein) synthase
MQVVALVEAICRRAVPGIPGLEQVADRFLLGKAGRRSRARDVRIGLVNSVGFDGHCCAVVVRAA